jgi:hypothetical protein
VKKQMFFVASLCSAIALTVIPANAQAGGVQSRIPFKFSVSGKTLPAGQYTMFASSNQVRIQDAHGKMVAMVLANDVSGRSAGDNGQIIFHCYREYCFLSEVWAPAELNGRQLLTSRTEADLAKEESAKYFALVGEKASERQ